MEQRRMVHVLEGAWAGSSGSPAARAVVAEAHRSIRCLCRGVVMPLIHTAGGAQHQGSGLSKAQVTQIPWLRTGITKPAAIRQGEDSQCLPEVL